MRRSTIKVAEMVIGPEKEIVGLVCGCIKTVDLRGLRRRAGVWRRRRTTSRLSASSLGGAVTPSSAPRHQCTPPRVSPTAFPFPMRRHPPPHPADAQALYRRRFAATEFFPATSTPCSPTRSPGHTFLAVLLTP
ncbi:unnamed protein product [Musa acuminata subsp. burmannicoides]